jgi:acetate kinase
MGDASDDTIVLALNSGSSSLKLALYSFCNGEAGELASAAAEEIGGEAWQSLPAPRLQTAY